MLLVLPENTRPFPLTDEFLINYLSMRKGISKSSTKSPKSQLSSSLNKSVKLNL